MLTMAVLRTNEQLSSNTLLVLSKNRAPPLLACRKGGTIMISWKCGLMHTVHRMCTQCCNACHVCDQAMCKHGSLRTSEVLSENEQLFKATLRTPLKYRVPPPKRSSS